MRSAARFQKPPTAILRRDPRPAPPWSDRDYLLIQALELYERSIHECGHSTYLSMHDDYAGHFAMTVLGTCQVCDAHARFRRHNKDTEPDGTVRTVKFHTRGMVDGQGAPFRQEDVTDGRS